MTNKDKWNVQTLVEVGILKCVPFNKLVVLVILDHMHSQTFYPTLFVQLLLANIFSRHLTLIEHVSYNAML